MRKRSMAMLALVAAAAARVAVRPTRPVPADPEADEPLGSLHGRPLSVEVDGGTVSAEVHGPEDARATVVLVHGYCLSDRSWHYQVRDLVAARTDLRVVTYDHRGHGRSGRTTKETSTLSQIAMDLGRVIEAVAAGGPVVLAGHSMGGMTIMALAEQRPELFSSLVTGVAFISTSSGQLGTVSYGLPPLLGGPARRFVAWSAERNKVAEAAGKSPRTAGNSRLLFGTGVSRAQERFILDVSAATPAATVADFLYTFLDHDRSGALPVLAQIPTTVLVGELDKLCPPDHSRTIAQALPSAKLVTYPGAGHMLPLERHAEVSAELLALVP
jgi:pimeloyl-ACP methyl ester carboxylesterase